MGSAGFLLIFAGVNAANLVLSGKTNSSRVLSATGVFVCIVALIALIWHTVTVSFNSIWILIVMVASSFAVEAIYRSITGRRIKKIHKNNR
jgi:hypothetical protein